MSVAITERLIRKKKIISKWARVGGWATGLCPEEAPLSVQKRDAVRHNQRWLATKQKRYPNQDIR